MNWESAKELEAPYLVKDFWTVYQSIAMPGPQLVKFESDTWITSETASRLPCFPGSNLWFLFPQGSSCSNTKWLTPQWIISGGFHHYACNERGRPNLDPILINVSVQPPLRLGIPWANPWQHLLSLNPLTLFTLRSGLTTWTHASHQPAVAWSLNKGGPGMLKIGRGPHSS
jgi:hypothetical protein